MNSNTNTFYCYDAHNRKYIRLAIVESIGLANLLIPTLKEIYTDNLYSINGKGSKYIPYSPLLVLNRVK
jgi:hypothetical protein